MKAFFAGVILGVVLLALNGDLTNAQVPPPLAKNDATLAWDAVTTNADNTPITDLAHYLVVAVANGEDPTDTNTEILAQKISTEPTTALKSLLGALPEGTTDFYVFAVDNNDNLSAPSNVLELLISNVPPSAPGNFRLVVVTTP